LLSTFEAQKKAVVDLKTKATEFSGLKADVLRAQQSSDELGGKIRQIAVAQDLPLDVRVLAPARPADEPVNSRYRLTSFGGVAGLLLGLGFSIVLHLTDGRLRSPSEVAGLLGLPVLGIIPHQSANYGFTNIGLLAHTDPMSDLAEAARNVRTALFSAARSTPVKTVLVTSPACGDGKSTLAANLAIAMAQAGSRTLLIDASFGDHIVQKIFDIRKIAGLSNVLAGHISIEKATCRTPVERLEVLLGGVPPTNSAELFNSPSFAGLIAHVSGRYQCVILDAPPVLNGPDARILGASADITLYVVRSGATEAKAADHGLDQLLSVGSRVLGAIINDVTWRYAGGRNRGMLSRLNTVSPDEHIEMSARRDLPGTEILQRRRAIAGLEMKKDESSVVPEIDVLD
jgi:capsular exopolysaccharide synthesis family protein